MQLLSSPDTKSSLPVLDFISRRYDLDALRSSMKLALRKAACRVYAMEVVLFVLLLNRKQSLKTLKIP